MPRPPKLPQLLKDKLYKTGQTRGATDDEIFQNRVLRCSTVLIPFSQFHVVRTAPDNNGVYKNGFIVLVKPEEYFDSPETKLTMQQQGLVIGENSLLFYETREQWNNYNPDQRGLTVATSRKSPLGGQYVARVPALTSNNSEKILHGFTTKKSKGAGIRVYEYASAKTISDCKLQLELLFWHCENSMAVAKFMGMSDEGIEQRMALIKGSAQEFGLDDMNRLREARIVDEDEHTICPLCLKQLSANGFFNRMEQALGREVHDLTVTELNLFHLRELRIGEFNHKPYNLGWGHHHCNVVTKDTGIYDTLKWMDEVVQTNREQGYEF